jgi:hypothetical protein
LVVVQVLAQVVDLAVEDLVADLAVADFLVVDLVVDGNYFFINQKARSNRPSFFYYFSLI